MPINVPQSVFDKYFDVIDSTFTIFGVSCQLVYIDKIEKKVADFDNLPTNNSMNPHRRSNTDYNRGGVTYVEVEKTEDITLKVYWDRKSWVKVSNDIVAAEGSIQTICFATDLPKILRAKEMIVHKGVKDIIEMRFSLAGEPFPMGLQQNKYFGCFWERS
jgi:hypothetical protein|tara:strand:+ start:448 stop:927 length:480 start_codon:yes stop_codon:yes gene_type:complete